VHYLNGAWAEILSWVLVLAGLAAFAGGVVLLERVVRRRSYAVEMPARLDRGHEWDLVMRRATKELARSPRVEALQANATVTIEAAEYAYNRLLLEYAKHCTAPSAPPAPEPAPVPEREAEEAPAEERAPLAA
jgi:hypothetical protein